MVVLSPLMSRPSNSWGVIKDLDKSLGRQLSHEYHFWFSRTQYIQCFWPTTAQPNPWLLALPPFRIKEIKSIWLCKRNHEKKQSIELPMATFESIANFGWLSNSKIWKLSLWIQKNVERSLSSYCFICISTCQCHSFLILVLPNVSIWLDIWRIVSKGIWS